MLATNTTPKDANASQAAGTWTYISRWTSPWLASGGTTTSPSMAVASRETTVAQPSARWAPRLPIRASALFTSLTEVSSPDTWDATSAHSDSRYWTRSSCWADVSFSPKVEL